MKSPWKRYGSGDCYDELITADCDLELCTFGKSTIFNFAAHRRPEHYRIITEQTGATPPAEG